MTAAALPCASPPGPALQRAWGSARVHLRGEGEGARLDRLFQQGSAKVRFPAARGLGEAVLINTAGGMAEGDRFEWSARIDGPGRACLTTQACEKIYGGRDLAAEAPAQAAVDLTVEGGGRLDWLPQETILFNRANLKRTLDAELGADGELLACEAVILGRRAMGEFPAEARLHDRWRIRRRRRLIFADDLKLEGLLAPLSGPKALLGGAGAYASVLLAAPDAEDRIDAIRALLPQGCGASAWEGKLFCRLLAKDGLALRRILIPLLTALRDGRPLPRLWTI